MGKSLILDLPSLPIHQCRRQNKIFLDDGSILFSQQDIFLKILIIEPFIIIHEQYILAFCIFYSVIPKHAGISSNHRFPFIALGTERRIEIGDKMYAFIWRNECLSILEIFINHEDNLKIIKCLFLQTFNDIFHVLIPSRRDDYAKPHIHNVSFKLQVSTSFLWSVLKLWASCFKHSPDFLTCFCTTNTYSQKDIYH